MASGPGDNTDLADAEDNASDKLDVISLMKATLPEYVVNCFLAAGYDVTGVITSMDISNNPGNSIELIENYISESYPGDPRYCNNPDSILSVKPFHFPPGHRISICNFVNQLKEGPSSKVASSKPTITRKRTRHPDSNNGQEPNLWQHVQVGDETN